MPVPAGAAGGLETANIDRTRNAAPKPFFNARPTSSENRDYLRQLDAGPYPWGRFTHERY